MINEQLIQDVALMALAAQQGKITLKSLMIMSKDPRKQITCLQPDESGFITENDFLYFNATGLLNKLCYQYYLDSDFELITLCAMWSAASHCVKVKENETKKGNMK